MKKSTKKVLLQTVSHRKWPLPIKSWSYYQEWNKALFLHWRVPADTLQQLLPSGLTLDTFENEAWISIVAFTMEKIRPKNLPSFSPVSHFHEINIRTYVIHNGKPGVYFLNIEAEKQLSAVISKMLSGLPYEKAKMKRNHQNEIQTYSSNQKKKGFEFAANYQVSNNTISKSELDLWLTERYCLYLDKGGENYLYEIHHLPWELQEVRISDIHTNYQIGSIDLNRKPDLIHYSKGIDVIAWKKELIKSK